MIEGNKSVWVSEPWDAGMGEKTESRSTLTVKDTNNVELSLEFKMDGKFAHVMTATLTRAK